MHKEPDHKNKVCENSDGHRICFFSTYGNSYDFTHISESVKENNHKYLIIAVIAVFY
jgi:CO dehydrogenase/acetyl-CoA synthase delta subunit